MLYTGSSCGYRVGVGGTSAVAAGGGVRGFPAVLTSFIGRDEPLREVAGLLERHRLVTVTGPGGSGKTRLADQVARQVAGRFADGAWLVELAPVPDEAQVAAVVAAGLGVREQPGLPAADAVGRVLARQQLLLVLDNCEHVIGAAAELCARLLAAADDVRVLATSREPLAIAGEARYRLGSLTLPGPGQTGDSGGSEAVALFADRARSAAAHFALDDQTAAGVARLVRRLDGMPLAIELAAARAESLGVGQLLDRLDDRLELLVGADRLAVPRQRSLAATVEWSYRLLDDQEQRVFRALSVFPAGFTLEAAEAVAGKGAGPTVLRLVDCSLLVPPRAGPDGRARYSMLETLRVYGAGLLAAAGEQDAAAAALAGFAAAAAGQAGAGLRTRAGEAGALRWLDAEEAAMRQALAWAVKHDPAAAVRLMDALGWWWLSRGRLTGQYPLLREAAGRAVPGSGWWCAAQFWAGWAALLSSIDRVEALGHFTALRDAMTGRAPSTALADGLIGRSAVLRLTGRPAEAAEEARQALVVSRELGYPPGQAQALAELSCAAWQQSDHHRAVRLARQAGQVTTGVPGTLVRVVGNVLAGLLIDAAEWVEAERVCAAALAWSREVGDLVSEAELLPEVAMLEVRAGRLQNAAAHLNAALQHAARFGRRGGLLNVLDCCGQLCAAAGRRAEAVTVWSALEAIAHREEIGEWSTEGVRRQESLRDARQALGPARSRAAEERGAAMSLDTAAEYALLLTEDPGPQASSAPGLGRLSGRERELVTLVAQGATNAQIAAQLFISVRTVSSHLDRIRDKTGCRRRADLTRLALTVGLV